MRFAALFWRAALSLTTLWPLAVGAAPPEQPPRWVMVDDLRVRAGPSAQDEVRGKLMRGSELILKGLTVGDYCLIEGENQYGFVACKYLSAERIARPRAGENGVDAAQRWVSGNGVTLREQPRQDAAVAGRLSLNAVVKLLRDDAGSGYCEVQVRDGPGGYTACRYLALTPVVLADIQNDTRASGAQSPDYDPERAFWLEPGWYALEAYVRYLQQRHPEIPPQGPWPRDEALERMKAHLALGLNGSRPKPYADWRELKRKAAQDVDELHVQDRANQLQYAIGIWGPLHDAISADKGPAHIVQLVRALEFPSIRPSLFRAEADVAPPGASAEQVSGRFGIVFRQLVARRSKPKPGEPNPGLYDMRARTQALVRPVQRVTLLRDGSLIAEPSYVNSTETLWRDDDEPECSGWSPGFSFGDADPEIWRYFEIQGADPGAFATSREAGSKRPGAPRLFEFYTPVALPQGRAIRSETTIKLSRDETGFVGGIHLHYDLDGDGVPDLAVWEGQGNGPGHIEGPTTTDDRWYRLVLVNIDGAWKVLGSDVFGYGCGC